MKSIQFLGAAGEVTGSAYLVTADNQSQVLVDYGMFQGTEEQVEQNYAPFEFNPAALEAVFLTHAHLDHSGRLPLLIFGGFSGKIYMTDPTKALVELILSDTARIAEKDLKHRPIYSSREVNKILGMIQTVSYDTEIATKNFTAIFRDAGHILGSSSIELSENGDNPKKIAFSGDLGNTPQSIVKPTQYIESADYVVMETTYGDKNHPPEDPMQVIKEEINTIEQTGSVLLIPAFSLERTQEVLLIIHTLKKNGEVKANTPIYLDSPMGITATGIYLDFDDFWNKELHDNPDNPFTFEGLHIIEDGRDSRSIGGITGPKVIIAGSGMMSGGRIMHHARNYLSKKTTRLLFVGYQAEETAGREILEGAKNVMIGDEMISVRANIREIETLSSHADQSKLLTWLSHIKGVQKVFLTHGEQTQREVFAEKVKEELKISDITLPLLGEEHSFE